MDSMIAAAAQALSHGDLLGALKRVALREDPPALALRGIAMAQLGDLARAKELLKRAARAFGTREPVARARCVVAEAEIALVSRELAWPPQALAAARATLAAHGDTLNAAHARHLEARRCLLIGQLDAAEALLADADTSRLPPALRAGYELAAAGIALRRLRMAPARAALSRAALAAQASGISSLMAEVQQLSATLEAPAARAVSRTGARLLRLDEVEALFASGELVVDACRFAVRRGAASVALASRPVLFALARLLAEAWPGDAARGTLIAAAFRTRHADESHRARLRVEIGRLRKALAGLAEVQATPDGFALRPMPDGVTLLLPPTDEQHGELLAFLADGEAWSSSALAIAMGSSARTVQRALEALAEQGKVQAFGRGPARRWTLPALPGFPSTLLLPGALPEG